MKFKRLIAMALSVLMLDTAALGIPEAVQAAEPDGQQYDFTVADSSGAADIYIDVDGEDYDGLSLTAEAFANDVSLVSGQLPQIKTDTADLGKEAVIAGTVEDKTITELSQNGKIDVSEITGKNEVYKIELVENPLENVERAIVIAGSDKRGAIYGMFHISELMGVSPWVYWGDALPEERSTVGFSAAELDTTSKEPSVRFRGIFLNDEYPNLSKWAGNTFNGYNHNFYQSVFELLLRLKGNYMWPAMWSNSFSEDGILGLSADEAEGFDTLENARLADKYGVIMGTSHHEPLCRAGLEWGKTYQSYMKQFYPDADASGGSSAVWNYFKYPNAIRQFWDDGYSRNKDFENVTTIGMRGEADSSLEGGLATNIENLKNVIKDQKEIIAKYGKQDEPTMLALYKEVEEYWYGGEENGEYVPGLRESGLADDAIIMLCDDNFGNLRSVPMEDERDREGGWGMYYHFDYHGAPQDYRWVSSTPLEKIWENMTTAYEYKIDDLWIVNVGDLKPHELEISYFLDLAYDYDAWKDENKVEEYARQWTKEQFGYEGVSDETINEIAQLQLDYLRLNGIRRPEAVYASTYSITDSNELYNIIDRSEKIYNKAYELYEKLPDRIKASYYQMVLYQAAGSANVNLMNAYSALNSMYSASGSMLANKYAALVKECIKRDTDMQDYYNNIMSGGKWKHMMSTELAHIGCTSWDLTEWAYPSAVYVKPADTAVLIVNADGTKKAAKSGEISLPKFTSTNKEAYAITVSNGGSTKLDYTASASADWIVLSKAGGSVYSGDTLAVTVDWSKLTSSAEGTITICGAGTEVSVKVGAEVVDTAGLADKTFIGKNGIISMEAEHYASASGSWITIDGLGKNLSSIKTKPYTADYTIDNAPYAEYRIKTENAGEYTVTAITGTNNPRTTKGDLRYAVSVDGGTPQVASALAPGFISGDHGTMWADGVMKNGHVSSQTFTISAGEHTIRFYPLSSGIVLQKLVVSETADIGDAFCGPEESWYAGADSSQQPLVHYIAEDTMNIPGVVDGSGTVIVSEDGPYTVKADADFTLKLDGTDAEVIRNADGTYEVTLASGEHEIEFTGASSLEFEVMNLVPGVVIDHPMSTEEEFASAAAGYINLAEGNDDKRSVSFSAADAAMNYTTTGLWYSSGLKYDITSAVKRVLEEYGEDTEFTLSMDIKSETGDGASVGFRNASGVIASTPLDGVSASGFTTVTCTSKLLEDNQVYFYLFANMPTSYVKNIRVTYPAPQKKELFTHTEGSDWADYQAYDDTNTAAVLTKSGDALGAAYNTASGWSPKNGVKLDVTDYIKQCDNGGRFGAAVTFQCWYWGGDSIAQVKAFLETESGAQTELCAGPADMDSVDNNTVYITGENSFTYNTGEKVYLCITQISDNHSIKDVTFWGYKTEGGSSVTPEPDNPGGLITLFEHNGGSDWDAYELYEENNELAVVTKGADSIGINYGGGEYDWHADNGIKLDVTEYLEKCRSGGKFEVSYNLTSYYWGDGEIPVQASVFFETADGRRTELFKAPQSQSEITDNTALISGSGTFEFTPGETVYLCLTHPTGYHVYKNIVLKGTASDGEEPAPSEPAPSEPAPSEKPSPDTRVIIFSEDFAADGEPDGRYSPYKDGSLKTVDDDGNPVENSVLWGRLAYNFSEGYSEDNGLKADITDIVKAENLTTVNASMDMLTYWWADKPAELTVEVRGEDGSVKQSCQLDTAPDDFADMNGTYVQFAGSADIEYEDTDSIYLCMRHVSGLHLYDNIILWKDAASEPAEKKLSAAAPVLNEDGSGAYITVSNTTDESVNINIYTAAYNNDNTLESVSVTTAEVEAGAKNLRIDFAAAAGDTVYVWGDDMNPIIDKTVLEEMIWIAGWGSAQQEYLASDLPSTALSGSIIRQRIRMSVGGDYMKLTFSNRYGTSDLVIGAVHLAKPLENGMIDASTDTAVTFNGSESVTIPAGGSVESDVICYRTDDLERVMMTIQADRVPEKVTGHSGARTTTYIKSGGTVQDAAMIGAETNEHWYFASEIDVLSAADYGVIACLGDSITDGRGVTTNADNRWTDILSERLNAAGMRLSVINDGIGGNCINNWGLGESGRDRYEKEIKDREGVKYLIVLEGINDIGGKTEDVFAGDPSKAPADGTITTGVKEAYQEIIDKAHSQGIKVIGGTILPCGKNDYYNEVSETMRQDLNEWIREEGHFDAVIDFDAVMCDENDPTKLKAEYDSGDGLHPGPAGYMAMGECIDLGLFD
ncbi:MAG: glycosyl hydrolase 115 family protein [Candidatus Ornithomonoglobus sp.]